MAMGTDQSHVSLPYLQDPMALMQNFPEKKKNYTCTQLVKTFFSLSSFPKRVQHKIIHVTLASY